MHEEMMALQQNETQDLASFPPGKQVVDCRWVYNIKLNLDGSLARLKARLVAKRYSQINGVDYQDTFSLVAKIVSVWILISWVATHHWPLHHQLDIKNMLLHSILDEEVYIE